MPENFEEYFNRKEISNLPDKEELPQGGRKKIEVSQEDLQKMVENLRGNLDIDPYAAYMQYTAIQNIKPGIKLDLSEEEQKQLDKIVKFYQERNARG